MALPAGSSPIQSAVLQLSRDLQQAISKAKTSLSAVATHARVAHTGSDSALPTSREGIFKRNLGAENGITSSCLLGALDAPRTLSLTALSDKAEEAQSDEVVEASGAMTNLGTDNVNAYKNEGFSTGFKGAPPMLLHSPGAENAVGKKSVMNKGISDEEPGVCSNTARRHSGKAYSNNFNAVAWVPSVAENVTGESTSATEQPRSLSTGKGKPGDSEERDSAAKWLHLTSPVGSSISLLAQRDSNKVSSSTSSVLLLSSSPPAPGVLDSASAAQSTSRRSSFLLETSSPPLTDFQDAADSPYRRSSTGVASSRGSRALVSPDAKQHLQRKKLTSPLACCSTGSSPCAPPLLSAALLVSPCQQKTVDKPMLRLKQGTEQEISPSVYDSCYSNFKIDSYSNVANPANSRLAEVENRWFFVDIVGEVPRMVEEIISQQQSFSEKNVAAGSADFGLVHKKTGESSLVNEETSSLLLQGADLSSSCKTVNKFFSNLQPVSVGTNRDDDIHLPECTLPATHVGALFGSASEYEPARDRPLLSKFEENRREEESLNCTVTLLQPSSTERREHEIHELDKVGETPSELMQKQSVLHEVYEVEAPHQHRALMHCEQEEKKLLLHTGRAQEHEDKELCLGAAEEMIKREDKQMPRRCSDGSIAGITMRVPPPYPCSTNSTTASSFFSKYCEQQPLLQLGLRTPYRFEHSSESQSFPHRHQEEVRDRQPVVNSATEGETLLEGALLSSAERTKRDGVAIGGRRHRMRKAEGTTSFASLEAMVEFVRNSTSLYGTAALEGVTFHVPAEDAESLVSALEETLPYSWRDFRCAALEVLKPLTALVVGRFVLLQLPSLFLEFAGGAVAENAAAAAAAAAEASGLSAVLAIAPWLIVFGGCVYAIIRGARALQASRRAQFLIYEDGESQTPRTRLPCENSPAPSASPEFLNSTAADSVAADSPARSATLGAVSADSRTAGSSVEILAGVLKGASLKARTLAGHLTSARQTSQLADAERVRAELGEQLESDSSEESDIEEERTLVEDRAAEDQTESVTGCERSASSMRGKNASQSSESSTRIVDLLSDAISRGPSVDGNYNVASGALSNGDREDDLYLMSSNSGKSGSVSGLDGVPDAADRVDGRLGRSSTTMYKDTGNELLPPQGTGETNDEIKVRCLPGDYTETSRAGDWANAADVAEPATGIAAVEDYVSVCKDTQRPLQEEEALQQQLLTCSAVWRDRPLSFEV